MSQQTEIPFIEDADGKPVRIPATVTKFRAKRFRGEGKAGRPAHICTADGLLELKAPLKPSDLAKLPTGLCGLYGYDANDKRVGERIMVEIDRLDDDGQDSPSSGAGHAGDSSFREANKRLESQCRDLHEALLKAMEIMGKAMEQMARAQVELAKQSAPVVDASASMVEAARSGGLGKAAEEIRGVLEAFPEDNTSNLETVLSSPLVLGAVNMLQKQVAEAARNGAEAVAGGGEPSRNKAAEIGRMLARAEAEKLRAKNKEARKK